MTIPRYLALSRHWRERPRPEWLIAAYLGFTPTPEPRASKAGVSRVPPPSGEMANLFVSLGGRPGQTVVVAG